MLGKKNAETTSNEVARVKENNTFLKRNQKTIKILWQEYV